MTSVTVILLKKRFRRTSPSFKQVFCKNQKTLTQVKITTEHISDSLVTFVTHKRFAVLFFLPPCCVNSLMPPNVPGFVEHWRHLRIRLSLAEVDALMIYWTASVGWKQHSDRAENLLRGLGRQQNKATEKYDDWSSWWRTELKVHVIELKAFKTCFTTLEKHRCHLLTIST